MDFDVLRLLAETAAAAVVGPAFAMVFGVRERYLLYIAASSAIGRLTRFALTEGPGMDLIFATFAAAALISLIYVFIAPRLQIPRPVFTAASVICLLPGPDAYRALFALLHLVLPRAQEDVIADVAILFQSGMRAAAVTLAICLGIAVMPIFFYRYRHRLL